jgi:hypothetical protein
MRRGSVDMMLGPTVPDMRFAIKQLPEFYNKCQVP